MTSVTRDVPTESVDTATAQIPAPPTSAPPKSTSPWSASSTSAAPKSAPSSLSASPVVRSAAAAGRTLSAKLGEHSDVVYVVLATIAFVVVAGLFGYALL